MKGVALTNALQLSSDLSLPLGYICMWLDGHIDGSTGPKYVTKVPFFWQSSSVRIAQ